MDHAKGPTDVSIITTYRCCMRCRMCDIWQNPSDIQREIQPKELEILPQLKFINITGGEPFVRNDLAEIIEVAFSRAPRVVISTAGYHTEDIWALAERFPQIGIRVSLEGFSQVNDHLRGRDGGFDRGLRTLLGLRRMGVKDIGIAMTVGDANCHELLDLYQMTTDLAMDFATATYHNSFYFHKQSNTVLLKDEVAERFFDLADELLKSRRPKDWFRAFFNLGLINYIHGNRRLLPCEAGSVNFFIEPYGDVYPCNGLEERYWKESMGNIRDFSSFDALWLGERARRVRELVASCPKNCWMVGTAAPVMKKYLRHPLGWVVRNKIGSMTGKRLCRSTLPGQFPVGQDARQGDLRGGQQFLEAQIEDKPVLGSQRLFTRVLRTAPCGSNAFRLQVERGDFRFCPGQFASVGPPRSGLLSRDYTFCSAPEDPFLELLVKKVPKGRVSNFLAQLSAGDMVEIIGPYGDFFSEIERYSRLVFVATGVGIGPFLSLLRQKADTPNYQLIHGIREDADLAMVDAIPKNRYISCMTRGKNGNFQGRITDYLRQNRLSEDAGWFLCGNPFMLQQVKTLLLEGGIASERIHTEPYYAY